MVGIDNIEHCFFTSSGRSSRTSSPASARRACSAACSRSTSTARRWRPPIRAMVAQGVAITSTLRSTSTSSRTARRLEQRVPETLAPGPRADDKYIESRADVASRDEVPMATLVPQGAGVRADVRGAGGLLPALTPAAFGEALPGCGDQRN